MAPRRRRRSRSLSPNGRRRGRPPAALSPAPTTNNSFGSADAQAILSRVAQLVQENQSLVRENSELRSTLAQIAEATQVSITSAAPSAPTNGQTEQAEVGTGTGGNGRRRRRRRGRISDPTTLERRRAALAKARAVLAAKRAAAARRSGAS
jgi:hypothetical protein